MARQLGIHAQAAALMRNELKKQFPSTKFSVTSQVDSMSNSIYVSWTDGPMSEMVNKITNKYKSEYLDRRDDLPQVRFVFATRRTA